MRFYKAQLMLYKAIYTVHRYKVSAQLQILKYVQVLRVFDLSSYLMF